VGVVEQLTWK